MWKSPAKLTFLKWHCIANVHIHVFALSFAFFQRACQKAKTAKSSMTMMAHKYNQLKHHFEFSVFADTIHLCVRMTTIAVINNERYSWVKLAGLPWPINNRVGYKIYTYLNMNKFLKRPPFFGYACHSEFRTLENK